MLPNLEYNPGVYSCMYLHVHTYTYVLSRISCKARDRGWPLHCFPSLLGGSASHHACGLREIGGSASSGRGSVYVSVSAIVRSLA